MRSHTGRRPESLVGESLPDARTVGESLAQAAYLEASSVHAFLDLARQLDGLGAPASFVRRAIQALAHETRHAKAMADLARARGSAVSQPPTPPPVAAYDFLSVATLNASEGCVRETWGAACALAQSKKAADRDVREAMVVIARDELAHAKLAWDVAEWIAPHLTPAERARVRDTQACAIATLEQEVNRKTPAPLRELLGLPTAEDARRIVEAMRSEITRLPSAIP